MNKELEEAKCEFRQDIKNRTNFSLVSIMIANDVTSYKESKLINAKDKEFANMIYTECERELKVRKIINE